MHRNSQATIALREVVGSGEEGGSDAPSGGSGGVLGSGTRASGSGDPGIVVSTQTVVQLHII